ncbi:MAG TPA: PRC-barrel domain-containing protein [Steroidobacteraceae bacterium]|jgi:hypothetical protein
MNSQPLSMLASLLLCGAAFAQQAPPATEVNRPPTSVMPAPTGPDSPSSTSADKAPDGTIARETPAVEPGASSGTAATKIVGRAVVTPSNAPLGKVSEIVFDATGQPAFVVISTHGKTSALPYAMANSMLSGDKVVIDKARLQGAPKLKAGEWRDRSSEDWKDDAIRYWERS